MTKMTDGQAYLQDFVTIETKFENGGKHPSWETSDHASVQGIFEEHLMNTRQEEGINGFGIDIYRIKVGDVIKLEPTTWAKQFEESHSSEEISKNDYEFKYRVVNIEITMYSRNPRADVNIPKLQIDITLSRVGSSA